MKLTKAFQVLATLALLRSGSAQCDEAISFESGSDPVAARQSYQQANQLFPLQAVGQCNCEIDGFPASPARPSLWERYMFGVGADGVPNKNFNANDLPIIDTYYDEEGRPVDVYETVTTATPALDLFYTDTNTVDSCRPADYGATNGFFVYGSESVPHFAPGPTVKNCRGRQGVMRFENVANGRPIGVHLHGAASVAPYDGWADDTSASGFTKNYFYPNNRAAYVFIVLRTMTNTHPLLCLL